MTDRLRQFDSRYADWILAGGVAVLVGLAVLIWPGPIALTDRLPFSLLFLVPGAFAIYHAYAESQSPI